MFEKLRKKSRKPSVNPYMRFMDIDFDTPDIFYVMDEIGEKQILRKYDKSSGGFEYCGTYQVLYKTERFSRHFLIMRRIANERPVPPEHHAVSGEEYETRVVAEYYPGLMCRVYLKGVSESMMQELTEDYQKKLARRQRRRLIAE